VQQALETWMFFGKMSGETKNNNLFQKDSVSYSLIMKIKGLESGRPPRFFCGVIGCYQHALGDVFL